MKCGIQPYWLVRQSFYDSQGYENKRKCRRHKVKFDLVKKM